MDKSWMHIVHRLTDPRYEIGVNEFLRFAYRDKNKSVDIPCPCKICNNFRDHKKSTVYKHLMQNGIYTSYDEWTRHGESCDVSDDSDDHVSFNDEDVGSDNMNVDNDDVDDDELDEMLDNIGQSRWGDRWKTSGESSSTIDKDLETLRRLLDESHQDLYTGCQSYSKFSFIVTILHLKTTHGWSNKSFNDLLKVFKKALPSPSSVPKNYYAMMHPPDGVQTSDWVNLCERFASEEFQKISARNKKNRSFNQIPPAVGTLSTARRVDMKKRKGEHITAIEQFEIAHFSEKTKKMVNEKAEKTLNELRIEEANSTLTPTEICLKQLNHIPGHIKGRSASTRNFLGNEKLRLDLESEKERSKALEENMKAVNEKQRRLQKQNKKIKGN